MEFSHQDYTEKTFERIDSKGLEANDCLFEGCRFLNCHFSGAVFRRCRFVDCEFEKCDLSNLQVPGAAFRSVLFRDCKIVGINWANAGTVSHLDFERCVLNYACFSGLDLRKSMLANCMAREADFTEADLSQADCRGTDFASARFSRTNLTKADFRQAINYTIRPGDNKLKKARFSLPEATLLLYGLDIELEEK